MPPPPRPLGHRLGGATATIEIEAFLDFCCPFSAKHWNRFVLEVLPLFKERGVNYKHYNVVQPWHAQSSYMHEAALAVEAVDANKYASFATALFAAQGQFFDDVTWDKSRAQIYAELAELAASSVGVDAAAVSAKLARKVVEGSHNTGNAVTDTLKFYTKFHRQRGMHVTPTVMVNGVVDDSISSGWTLEQWTAYLDGMLPPVAGL